MTTSRAAGRARNRLAALALAWAAATGGGMGSAEAQSSRTGSTSGSDREAVLAGGRLLAAAEKALLTIQDATAPRAVRSCLKDGRDNPEARLRITDGRVRDAELLGEMAGYAREAGTTGGLGHRLYLVTTPADYDPRQREAPIPGSLRAGVEFAQRNGGAWIRFDPSLPLGATIPLKRQLNLPPNTTLDGSCADVTLIGAPEIPLLYIRDVENIVIYGLGLRKTYYVEEEQDTHDAVSLTGRYDRVWVAHNDFAACGDGCVDVVRREPVGAPARVTVAFNRFEHHNKTMLVGVLDCYDNPESVLEDACRNALSLADTNPRFRTEIFLTLQGNYFRGTSQRHPRVSPRALAHVVNNVIAYAPTRYPNGQLSAAYGVAALTGGRALVERNVMVSLRNPTGEDLGAWSVSAENRRNMEDESPGGLKLIHNRAVGRVRLEDSQPATVPDISLQAEVIPVERMEAEVAASCIIRRAGRFGEVAVPGRGRACNPRG